VALDPASNGSAEGSPERVPELGGPLDGQRVLELATLNAGPSLTAMLGDLGAEVVKVELPSGDDFRILGTATDDALRPGLWNLVARNKRMVTLDYKRPEGVALLAKLTVAADIIVCNQPRSLLERLDCTYESIAARNPRAVVVQVSGWGATGPYADLPGNGTLGEAFAGLTDLQRDASDTPRLTGALLGDHLTALAGVIGTLAACYWRDAQGGTGQLVDVALYEAVVAALGPQIVTWDPEPATAFATRFAQATIDGLSSRPTARPKSPGFSRPSGCRCPTTIPRGSISGRSLRSGFSLTIRTPCLTASTRLVSVSPPSTTWALYWATTTRRRAVPSSRSNTRCWERFAFPAPHPSSVRPRVESARLTEPSVRTTMRCTPNGWGSDRQLSTPCGPPGLFRRRLTRRSAAADARVGTDRSRGNERVYFCAGISKLVEHLA
jgi:hypothetical protein